jgi:hypothetical protein
MTYHEHRNFTFFSILTITILDIIRRPVFYIKHDVSEIGFCPRLQVEPTQVAPLDGAIMFPISWNNTNSVYKTTNERCGNFNFCGSVLRWL